MVQAGGDHAAAGLGVHGCKDWLATLAPAHTCMPSEPNALKAGKLLALAVRRVACCTGPALFRCRACCMEVRVGPDPLCLQLPCPDELRNARAGRPEAGPQRSSRASRAPTQLPRTGPNPACKSPPAQCALTLTCTAPVRADNRALKPLTGRHLRGRKLLLVLILLVLLLLLFLLPLLRLPCRVQNTRGTAQRSPRCRGSPPDG